MRPRWEAFLMLISIVLAPVVLAAGITAAIEGRPRGPETILIALPVSWSLETLGQAHGTAAVTELLVD
jgi:hypothetical protein